MRFSQFYQLVDFDRYWYLMTFSILYEKVKIDNVGGDALKKRLSRIERLVT
jgi:hypothetical protein